MGIPISEKFGGVTHSIRLWVIFYMRHELINHGNECLYLKSIRKSNISITLGYGNGLKLTTERYSVGQTSLYVQKFALFTWENGKINLKEMEIGQ
ncbi:MAG: hypothetical protein ACI4BI_03700 [Anaerotardibacter sp.]